MFEAETQKRSQLLAVLLQLQHTQTEIYKLFNRFILIIKGEKKIFKKKTTINEMK